MDHRIVAVETGNGLGKGFLIGRLVPWFLYPNGPHVPALFKELGELRYRLKAEKSELETKQDLMLRLDRSPDFADALCMAFREAATYGN